MASLYALDPEPGPALWVSTGAIIAFWALPPALRLTEPATILVVEDDENLRHLLGRMLERSGFAVVTAVHGRDALRRLGEQAIGLVVTDMLMPEMDGVELMRLLRAERPSLPVIAISGVEEWAAYLRIAVHLGAKATLRKPVVAAELVRTVRKALAVRATARSGQNS